MRIALRIIGHDLPEGRIAGFDIPAAATIQSALAEYIKQFNTGLSLSEISASQFLVNGAASPIDRELCDGDQLTLIRVLGGG